MITIDIEAKSKKWQEQKNIKKFIKDTCKKIIPLTDLRKILAPNFELELSILLVCDSQIKKINNDFRGKNKATNVLSFPTLDENLIRQKGLKQAVKGQKYLFLGDIVISYETIKKESLAQKKEICNHIAHMLLHSVLHLIGYDHEKEEMAKIMEELEIQILQKIGISNPYY